MIQNSIRHADDDKELVVPGLTFTVSNSPEKDKSPGDRGSNKVKVRSDFGSASEDYALGILASKDTTMSPTLAEGVIQINDLPVLRRKLNKIIQYYDRLPTALNFHLYDVRGDGNCGWYCWLSYLEYIKHPELQSGGEQTIQYLRQRVCDYVQEAASTDDLLQLCYPDEDFRQDELLRANLLQILSSDEILTPGRFLDRFHIIILSEIFNVNVVVFTPFDGENHGENNMTVTIRSRDDENHDFKLLEDNLIQKEHAMFAHPAFLYNKETLYLYHIHETNERDGHFQWLKVLDISSVHVAPVARARWNESESSARRQSSFKDDQVNALALLAEDAAKQKDSYGKDKDLSDKDKDNIDNFDSPWQFTADGTEFWQVTGKCCAGQHCQAESMPRHTAHSTHRRCLLCGFSMHTDCMKEIEEMCDHRAASFDKVCLHCLNSKQIPFAQTDPTVKYTDGIERHAISNYRDGPTLHLVDVIPTNLDLVARGKSDSL